MELADGNGDGDARIRRARLALEGLSVGDAFGERFFGPPQLVQERLTSRAFPKAPWKWTDDTAMALSVVECLEGHSRIEPRTLAMLFAARLAREPDRGYGGAAYQILSNIARGTPYEIASKDVFGGEGSMGNGGGMRSAPIGAFFADDLDAVVHNARLSALPTHAHPDGQAGAIAVAVAAALSSRADTLEPRRFIENVIELTPTGLTRDKMILSLDHLESDSLGAAAALGSGARVISSDTIPFSILCAARHLDNFEEALWFTVNGLGDRDTTCAIVGGIVALGPNAKIPRTFVDAREPLPIQFRV